MNFTFVPLFFTVYGLLTTVRARLETKMTSLAACVNGPITLPGKEPSRFPVRDQWWKFRYPDDDWINVRYCDGSLNCVTMRPVLPDGITVSIGAHESLVVERITQNSKKDRVQFLLEVFFDDNTVLRHSFEVNFTDVCVWTWLQANLNLSEVFLGQYPPEQLKEIQLFDANENCLPPHRQWCFSQGNRQQSSDASLLEQIEDNERFIDLLWDHKSG
ncbi:uncharacterized protein [Montipora foliosa]|uniref:uncharacterized protein n=1 Tax=Montipora foliosa TaxID=591990 RepID=UPI0035F1F606